MRGDAPDYIVQDENIKDTEDELSLDDMNLEDEPDSPTEIKIGCTTGTWDEFVAIYEKAKSML